MPCPSDKDAKRLTTSVKKNKIWISVSASSIFGNEMHRNKNVRSLLAVIVMSTFLVASSLGQNVPGHVLPLEQDNASALSYSTFSFRPLKDPVVDSYLPVISGYFGNDPKSRGSFVLDTGASYSLLTEATAKRLNLITLPAIRDGKRAFVGSTPLNYTDVPSFKISPTGLFDTPIETNGVFGVVPEKTLFSLLRAPLDGIIGDDHWSKIGLVFDFPSHLVTAFAPAQVDMTCLHRFGFDKAHFIALSLDKDAVPTILLHISRNKRSIDEQVIVDTGASSTQISHQGAMKLGLKPAYKGIGTANISGTFYTNEAVVDTLQIGDLTLHNVTVTYSDSDNDAGNLMLGMDVLQHYKMLLSIADKKMYLQPTSSLVPAVTVGAAPATATPPAR